MISTTYPNMTVDEIVELLGGPAGREIVDIENARRAAEYQAWATADVVEHNREPLPGGPLVVGEWYNVTRGGGISRARRWLVCRYLGRSRRYGYGGDVYAEYRFERWGAKAATDKWARGSIEPVGIGDRVFEVERITPDPRLLAKLAERETKRA